MEDQPNKESETVETPSTEQEVKDQLYDHESSIKKEEEDAAIEKKEETVVAKEEVKEEVKEESKEEVELKYDLKLGEESNLHEDHAKGVEEFAKENGLTNDAAQKLLDNQDSLVGEYKKNQDESYWKEVEGWETSLKEDKDFGGEKYNENVKLAQKAFLKYTDQDTQKLFEEKGYGNHPGLVKAFAKIGRELSGDTFERGRSSESNSESFENAFYGKK